MSLLKLYLYVYLCADIFIYCIVIVCSNCAGLPIRRTRCHCYNGSTGFNHPQALEPSRGWTLSSTAIVECAPVCSCVHLCAPVCSCVLPCATVYINVHKCVSLCPRVQCTSMHQSAPVYSLVHQWYSHVHLCTSVCSCLFPCAPVCINVIRVYLLHKTVHLQLIPIGLLWIVVCIYT